MVECLLSMHKVLVLKSQHCKPTNQPNKQTRNWTPEAAKAKLLTHTLARVIPNSWDPGLMAVSLFSLLTRRLKEERVIVTQCVEVTAHSQLARRQDGMGEWCHRGETVAGQAEVPNPNPNPPKLKLGILFDPALHFLGSFPKGKGTMFQ